MKIQKVKQAGHAIKRKSVSTADAASKAMTDSVLDDIKKLSEGTFKSMELLLEKSCDQITDAEAKRVCKEGAIELTKLLRSEKQLGNVLKAIA